MTSDDRKAALDPAATLWTACGLCCNGSQFDFVEGAEPERERLADLGLGINDWHGRLAFDQPCPCLEGRSARSMPTGRPSAVPVAAKR